jgi:endonuclease G
MSRRLVLIHGRSQHGKDPDRLRRSWVAGLNKGLTLADQPPVEAISAVFLYYGDLIMQEIQALGTRALAGDGAAGMAAASDGMLPGLGVASDDDVVDLQLQLLAQASARAGSPLPEARAQATRGILDELQKIEAIQSTLDWVSDAAPWMGERLLYLVTRDVSLYLAKDRVRDAVQESLVLQLRNGVGSDGEIVLVTHSLGTVVGMDLVSHWATAYDVALFVTCGSPLGIPQINERLKLQPQPGFPPGVQQWFNAFDPRDVVALKEQLAPLYGGGLNDIRVHNGDRPHAIDRYLGHEEVAHHIGTALART